MVDTRLRGEWLHNPRFDDLSDPAWRLFTLAMMWSNQQGTDGEVPTRYLQMLHPDVGDEALPELEAAGVLETTEAGIAFLDWTTDLGQSAAEDVSRKRTEARERMRSLRESRRLSSPGDTANVRANEPMNVGQAKEALKASSPSAYVPANVRANTETCPKHPVDTGEPCGTCMRIRQERDARRPAAGGEARAIAERCRREGHLFNPGDLYCNRCGDKRDPNAWMEPRETPVKAKSESGSNGTCPRCGTFSFRDNAPHGFLHPECMPTVEEVAGVAS
jgi:hypothetical protein